MVVECFKIIVMDENLEIIGYSTYKKLPIYKDVDGERVVFMSQNEYNNNRERLKIIETIDNIHILISN